jgi:predicted nucleic acid-binding protein
LTESGNELDAYVIDASVILKWTLKSEELADKALDVLTDYLAGKLALYAPANVLYEVPGALRTAVSRKRLSYDDAVEAVAALHDLGLTPVGSRELTLRAFSLAHERMLSFYDSLYLALSEASGYPLLYADSKITPALVDIPGCYLADYQRRSA